MSYRSSCRQAQRGILFCAAFSSAADQKRSTQLLPLVTESLSNASAPAFCLSLTHSQCEPVKNAAKDFVQVKLPLFLEEVCQSPLKVMQSISYSSQVLDRV